jgi:hypothetical protein
MGLLDDAIRDHLELKRRHGADPSEVARQEQEAFGPARDEAPDGAAGDAEAFDAEDEYEPRPGDKLGETTDEEEPLYDEDLLDEDDDDAFGVDRHEQPTATHDAVEGGGDDTRPPAGAVRADDIVPADEEAESDDVLEETPEFLQETPEHDRLWFEQHPPRDFDF